MTYLNVNINYNFIIQTMEWNYKNCKIMAKKGVQCKCGNR